MNEMKNTIEALLKKMSELVPVRLENPADEAKLRNLGKDVPDAIKQFWQLHDGCEIDIPGTVILSVDKALEAQKDSDILIKDLFPIGNFNFGDWIYMNGSGNVIQIDHEEECEFLTWDGFDAFLEDCLDWCGEE